LTICALIAAAAVPFWEAKPPAEWSAQELRKLAEDSPWAQIAQPARGANAPGVQIYLASAQPLRQFEAEFARRHNVPNDILRDEYEQFLRKDAGKSLVLAVYLPDSAALAEAEESQRMVEESVMKVGRKRVRMSGHFPPSSSDPYLRLVFPRPEAGEAKALEFELYLPGIPAPYRQAEFRFKDLVYRGKPEY
jgi:hypothetical protein